MIEPTLNVDPASISEESLDIQQLKLLKELIWDRYKSEWGPVHIKSTPFITGVRRFSIFDEKGEAIDK